MHTRRTLIGLMFLAAAAPALALDGPRTNPIQLAQATSVTKFRGLFLGMSASELDAAVAAIGATKEKFTDLFSQKVDPNKFNLKRGSTLLGFILFDQNGRVQEMRLENDFFDMPGPVPLRDFAEKLAKAYGIPRLRYDRTTNVLGSFWAYMGDTSTGERLLIADYMGTQEPSVEITKARSGAF